MLRRLVCRLFMFFLAWPNIPRLVIVRPKATFPAQKRPVAPTLLGEVRRFRTLQSECTVPSDHHVPFRSYPWIFSTGASALYRHLQSGSRTTRYLPCPYKVRSDLSTDLIYGSTV